MSDNTQQQLANLKQAYRAGKVTGAEYRDQRWSIELVAKQNAERAAQANRWR
jgi:hypothetical protein